MSQGCSRQGMGITYDIAWGVEFSWFSVVLSALLIHGFITIMTPITDCIRAGKFSWSDEVTEAFE